MLMLSKYIGALLDLAKSADLLFFDSVSGVNPSFVVSGLRDMVALTVKKPASDSDTSLLNDVVVHRLPIMPHDSRPSVLNIGLTLENKRAFLMCLQMLQILRIERFSLSFGLNHHKDFKGSNSLHLVASSPSFNVEASFSFAHIHPDTKNPPSKHTLFFAKELCVVECLSILDRPSVVDFVFFESSKKRLVVCVLSESRVNQILMDQSVKPTKKTYTKPFLSVSDQFFFL